MSLLRTEPPAAVRSLDELFAIAAAMEQEAAARYAELADRMRAADLPAVADAFERLAEAERGHADHVAGWSRSSTGAEPDPAWIRWQPPDTFDEEEAAGIASSRLASAYRALSMAVRNEERAFALWTYIAAQSDDPAIQDAAERMAREELDHATLLRRERRRAFHAERERNKADAALPRLPPVAQAARAERDLARLLATLADAEPSPERRRLAEEAAAMADEAAALAGGPLPAPPGTGMPPGAPMSAALRLAERAVEAYLEAADAASEEAAMHRVQALAGRAIARVASLRRLAGEG